MYDERSIRPDKLFLPLSLTNVRVLPTVLLTEISAFKAREGGRKG